MVSGAIIFSEDSPSLISAGSLAVSPSLGALSSLYHQGRRGRGSSEKDVETKESLNGLPLSTAVRLALPGQLSDP